MGFKIIKTNANQEKYEASYQAYQDHLAKSYDGSNKDLYRYFGSGFFHDGTINSITFKDIETIQMDLNCPNIRKYLAENQFEFINTDFSCTFNEVRSFKTTCNKLPTEPFPKDYLTLYLDSEIDSAIPKRAHSQDEMHSLIMRTLSGNSRVWIELLFSSVCVTPKEPAAFALMETNPNFSIPFYQGI